MTEEAALQADASNFASCEFSAPKLSSDTKLSSCSFPGSEFSGIDMTALDLFPIEALIHAKADPGTRHPGEQRPPSWPAYDPEYESIPF